MGEVSVERSVEWEVLRVVGDGAVDTAVAAGDVLLGEASEEL